MILSLYSSSCAGQCPRSFVTVRSLQEAKHYLDQTNKESLIFIDVDSMLTTPSDFYLRRHAIQRHKTIYDNLVGSLTIRSVFLIISWLLIAPHNS